MITQQRNLRTGTPVWADDKQPQIRYSSLDGSLSTDIVIVGAGVTGAMMAEALSGQGLDVAVFDKRPPLTGSTAASTALLQYEIDEPLTKLTKKIGEKNAAAAWRRSKLGLESLAVKIRELKIDCGFERRQSLYLAGNILNPDRLEAENKARNAIGLCGTMIDRNTLRAGYGIKALAGIMSWDNLACNPVRMAGGFLNEAVRRGAKIYSPVEITGIKAGRGHSILTADTGQTIKAKIVIFATGYELLPFVPQKKHAIHSTWALSTRPVKSMPDDFPMLWEASDPYNYGRTTQNGCMVFGGEDEEFSNAEKRDALLPRKQKILERKLSRLLPDFSFTTDHVWTGSFGGSTTGLPSMGKIPGWKNCYAVMAYGGNGITFSRIAAEIISGEILGYQDPDAMLFAFNKKS